MDNIGDWLYIVLLVIAGISSLISSGKKKREKNVVPPPPQDVYPETETTPVKGFWEMFEEELKPKQIPILKKEKSVKEKKSSKTSSPFLDTEKYMTSALTDSSSNILQESIEDESSPIFKEEDFRNLEGIKKAIVYSEILNRKY